MSITRLNLSFKGFKTLGYDAHSQSTLQDLFQNKQNQFM